MLDENPLRYFEYQIQSFITENGREINQGSFFYDDNIR